MSTTPAATRTACSSASRGNNLGYTTDLFIFPEHGTGAVVLTNGGGANAFRSVVRRRLIELLLDGADEARGNLEFAVARRAECSPRSAPSSPRPTPRG